jgi:hypothetical protein
VLGDPGWLSCTDLHGRGSEVDEPLDKPSLRTSPAKLVPEAFPGFVCFPGVALVEEVEGVEPVEMRGEEGGDGLAAGGGVVGKLVEREWDWLGRLEEVPAGVVHGMR